jgi:hypothetical protein
MIDRSKFSFAIIRFNQRTYVSGGVVAVVKGQVAAKRALKDFEETQSSEDRQEGWRYFLEESTLTPGMDTEQATKLRQLQFDRQESEV